MKRFPYCAATLSIALLVSLSACKTPGKEPAPSSEPPTQELTFTRENFPRLDGSADAVPLAQAMAAVVLGEFQQQTSDLTQFSDTHQALERLQAGECDLVFLSDPPQSLLDQQGQEGCETTLEELASDALVFVVHADNPVDSLTVEQLQGIYTGTITNWKEVGGRDEEILPFQHITNSGSQALLDRLVLDGQAMTPPPSTLDPVTFLQDAVVNYHNSPNAIGYTFYRHTQDLDHTPQMKLLKVDGVAPLAQTVTDHTYPLSTTYYMAMKTQQAPNSPASGLFRWMLSQNGQQLLKGYPSTFQLKDDIPSVTVTAHWDMLEPIHSPKSERWYEDYTDHLIPSTEYGALVPYIGGSISYASSTQWMYGLATQDGVIVTDPVFTEAVCVGPIHEPVAGTTPPDMLLLTTHEWKADGTYQQRLGLAAKDGSWYTGQVYQEAIRFCELGALMNTPEGDWVMVGPDGTQVPFQLSQTVPMPTLPTSLSFPYLYWSIDDTMTNFVYVDLRSGTVYRQPPADFQAPTYQEGVGYFPEGWFKLDGTTLTIHPTEGDPHSFDVGEHCIRADVNGDRVLLSYDTPESFRLTDWDGNTLLYKADEQPYFLTSDQDEAPSLISYNIRFYPDPTANYVVLSRDGKSPFAAQGFVFQYGNRLLYATQSHYILSNLAGDPLLCLPRLDA